MSTNLGRGPTFSTSAPSAAVKPSVVDASAEQRTREMVDGIYRAESSRVLSTLIRLLGDFDVAEDAMQAAFAAAVQQWTREGVPSNPRAWLVSTGRFKAIDAIRRDSRLFTSLESVAAAAAAPENLFASFDETSIEDDRLRLIFTCCHPALPRDGQIALTLREVCGLTTDEIARAFLTPVPTIAQRIVRAKAKIRQAKIPYEVPPRSELVERTDSVLHVTYLLFNEGYYASSGDTLTRQVLSDEAIRLGRLIAELLPEPEVLGLLALMLLQESRRAARATENGDVIVLAQQDRSRWDRGLISEGLDLCKRALAVSNPGSYVLQAGIAAAHVEGALAGATDWNQVITLYDRILDSQPSSVVELNRAAAVAMRDGPAAGLALVDRLLERDDLQGYVLAHATRADLCRRLSHFAEAKQSYARALELSTQAAERRFLEKRLGELS